MKHADKWRETLDITTLSFQDLRILEVLGYPHAGNDVFHVKVAFQGKEMTAFIKVERQLGADIANEVSVIQNLTFACVPEILAYSLSAPKYIVTKEIAGERLSAIIKKENSVNVKMYLARQAELLCEYHKLQNPCHPVKDRTFFHIPTHAFCIQHGLECIYTFLTANAPKAPTQCFVHGDFHYANILWDNEEISGVLDYELSGMGIREFDMAWSVFLRPGQTFLLFWDEVMAFWGGYTNQYCFSSFCYYYVQIAAHFYPLGNESYMQSVIRLAKEAISAYLNAT